MQFVVRKDCFNCGISPKRCKVSVSPSENRSIDLIRQTQAREARLDRTIKTLQDSVHADRHFRTIKAKLDTLIAD